LSDLDALTLLETGTRYRFADWPNPAVPKAGAGVYTIWDATQFIYVGMAGTASVPVAADEPVKARGLYSRLNSHASGRRSGDQFCVYVCDRFIVPDLSDAQLAEIGAGRVSLDHLTRSYIRERYDYRLAPSIDRAAAFELERGIQGGALAAGKPYLNPR
jgi:hypothetical protein